jgi:hypothetical protein
MERKPRDPRIACEIPAEDLAELEKLAVLNDCSVSRVVRFALKMYLLWEKEVTEAAASMSPDQIRNTTIEVLRRAAERKKEDKREVAVPSSWKIVPRNSGDSPKARRKRSNRTKVLNSTADAEGVG